jgi:hypothetical protein
VKELFCEFCGNYGDCAVCRSMIPDPPSRSFAIGRSVARSGVYSAVWSRRGWFAAVALTLCGSMGLVCVAVAALVGW